MTNSITNNLVLRFRDIERTSGETVALHRRCIESVGYTWWGWLYRQYERIPGVFLEELKGEINDGASKCRVYLYDTGQSKVYAATCTDVSWTRYPDRSPNARATPAYYNDGEAPAWFKFTDILEVDSSLLVGLVCASMPSASDDCAIDLLESRVTKLKDLRRQEVTMWVLAPYADPFECEEAISDSIC